jgi:hypothetical protein
MRLEIVPSCCLALALGMGCIESTTYTPLPPSVPRLLYPFNGAYVAGAATPRLRWEASPSPLDSVEYEVQISSDRRFETELISSVTAGLSFQPEQALPVSSVPPVGREYFWRARACHAKGCSDYSTTRNFYLGRSQQDFNGDGYSDLAIGAIRINAAGTVYVYFGGTGPFDTVADGILTNSLPNSSFGETLASASDFNGDGFSDLLVGAPSVGLPGDSGTAYLYFGGPGTQLDSMPDMTLIAGAAGDRFGGALSSAGDVNADGFSDLVIGAPYSDSVGVNAGRAYVFLGGSSGPRDVPQAVLNGHANATGFGKSVSNADDVNGDGFADIVVDEVVNDERNGVQNCTSRIFAGGSKGISPESIGEIDRATVYKCILLSTGAGDLNSDGFADIVNAISTRNAGIANLYLGGSPFDGNVTSSLEVDDIGELSAGRDLNGDQIPDIAVIDGVGECQVRVAFGAPSGIGYGPPQQVRSGLDCLLVHVAQVPDINADGIDDLTIGLVNQGGGASQVFIYFGAKGSSLDLQVDAVLTGAAGDYFGSSIATP